MNGTTDRHLFDRRLFMAAAIGFPLIVLAGFAQTYYLKLWFAAPPLPSLLVHLHGLVMTAWVLLFVVQVWFISSKQIRLHQRLGYAGVGIGALVIATGIPTALRAAKFGSASAPPGIPPLSFLIIPLADVVVFAVLFGGAIYYRRKAAAHKSLMLLTAVALLPPAVARIPVASLQALGPIWFLGLPTVLAITCLVLDARRRGFVNKVFLTGTIVLIASYVVRLAVMPTQAWTTVATWLVSFV